MPAITRLRGSTRRLWPLPVSARRFARLFKLLYFHQQSSKIYGWDSNSPEHDILTNFVFYCNSHNNPTSHLSSYLLLRQNHCTRSCRTLKYGGGGRGKMSGKSPLVPRIVIAESLFHLPLWSHLLHTQPLRPSRPGRHPEADSGASQLMPLTRDARDWLDPGFLAPSG